mgnify:CR=1 FL=1
MHTCVAMPTGHVLVWHLRIMMQPRVIRGAVANPNSSAPNSAATVMSRPVRICPSACLRNTCRQQQASEQADAVWTATQGFEALTRALNGPAFAPIPI